MQNVSEGHRRNRKYFHKLSFVCFACGYIAYIVLHVCEPQLSGEYGPNMAENMTKMAIKKIPDGVYRLRMAIFEVFYFLRSLKMGLFGGVKNALFGHFYL